MHVDLLAGKRVHIGEGATGYVLKKRKPVENVDPSLDLAAPEGGKPAGGFRTMVSRPLMVEERLIGAITLYSAEFAAYQPEHFRLLETVSKIAADVIEKSRRHTEAAAHAHTDAITGLPNARSLQAQFDKEVKRASRTGTSFQLLMLDLDGFKAVNDTFGHKAGDAMLTAIGGVIRGELREYDFLARYAGDEFVALVPDTDTEAVRDLCRRIEQAVRAFGLPVRDEAIARVGVSIGSAGYPLQGESFDQLVISADKAMYLTKASRKRLAAVAEKPVAADDARDESIHISMVPEVVHSGEQFFVEVDERHIMGMS